MAVEVSSVIDRMDIERALRRAKLLQKAGFQAIPVAAGTKMTEGAREEAQTYGVAILKDGGQIMWDEALALRKD